jgi:predicted O-methyltransferase YrrM
MNFEEKYLPNQIFNRNLFSGKKDEYEKKLYFKIDDVLNLNNSFLKNKFNESFRHTSKEMASNPLFLNFIKFLIDTYKPKSALEIGTFIGVFSTIIAKTSIQKVHTIEKFPEFFNIAQKNFILNKVNNKIHQYLGDAQIVLKKIKKKFDLVFIDGDKGNYLNIFKIISKNNIKKNSMIIFDDIFFHGDILNKKFKTSKGKGIFDLLNFIKKDKKFTKTILPIYGGVLIIKKN